MSDGRLAELSVAIQEGKDDVVSFILSDRSLPLGEKNLLQGGNNPDSFSPLHWACHCDEPRFTEMLLNHPNMDSNIRNKRGGTCLHTAAGRNASQAALAVIQNRPFEFPLNATNCWGETSVHLAASAGHENVLRVLIAGKCDVNLKDQWGRTPLRTARECGETGVVNLLQEVGAEDDGGPVTNLTNQPQVLKTVQRDIAREFMEVVQTIKVEKQVPDVDLSNVMGRVTLQPKSAVKPAQRAALSKMVEYPGDPHAISKMLHSGQFDPAGKDMFGWTALHKFAAWNKKDLIELLAPFLSIEEINLKGGVELFSPLHSAVEMAAEQSLIALTHLPGVDIRSTDKCGRTPLQLAEDLEEPILAKILRDACE